MARAAHRGRRESTARGGRTAPLVAARGAGLQVADELDDQPLLLALGDEVVAAFLQMREQSAEAVLNFPGTGPTSAFSESPAGCLARKRARCGIPAQSSP
ncbi:hypothetical protein ACIPWB_30830 [[Kitasatospora] papulosa]|uniref:hypothetical protein n=1 Tax=[Kitasatospora] papulosa TaxID=1464011 RepID=UPI00382B284C